MIWLFVLALNSAFATEDWLCTTEAAVREGTKLSVCGIGESMYEGDARSRALRNAIEDGKLLCEVSSDCRDHKTKVLPQRTSCSQDKQGLWKCFRLVVISIDE